MRTTRTLLLGVIVALIFWLLDSILDSLLLGAPEFTLRPRDDIELYMRLMGCGLIVAFAWFVGWSQSRRERELRAAERTLTESERKYEFAERLGKFGHWQRDFAGGTSYHSPGAFQIFGIDPDTFDESRDRFLSLVHPGDRVPLRAALQEAFEQNRSADETFRVVQPDGSIRVINLVATPYGDQAERPQGLVGTYLDVTERERAESEVRDSDRRLVTLFNMLDDSIMVADEETNLIIVNDAARREIGSGANLTGGELLARVHPEDIARLREAWSDMVTGGLMMSGLDIRFRVTDGDYHIYECNGYPMQYQGQRHYFVAARDVTERREAERELEASERRYRDLVDQSPDIIWRTDPDLRFSYISPSLKQVAGFEPEEWIGRHAFDSVPDLANNSAVWSDYERVRGGEMEPRDVTMEISHPRKDGTEFLAEIRAHVTLGDEGRVVEIQGITRDITERRRLERDLQKIQRLESIGVLAGGIAHDLNNLLTIIRGNLALLEVAIDPAEREETMEAVDSALEDLHGLSRQLLTFSQGGAPVRKPTDLSRFVVDWTRFALRGTNVTCAFDLTDRPWIVDIDAGQMHQVINNLVLNAKQAMPDGGEVRVAARNLRVTSAADLTIAPGDYLQISVTDQGPGINEEDLSRIFDPFYTTKRSGSGLGLATSHSIIQQHGGCIDVRSRLGEGTTFEVYLPAAPVQAMADEPEAPPIEAGEGRVLVLDDDPEIRKLASRMLSLLGYDAVAVPDGAAAIEEYLRARDEGEPFDAVILDLTVPGGMGGKEAILRLKEIDPAVRAIVSSGYSNDAVLANYMRHGFQACVNKPFSLAALSTAVQSALADDG